MLFIILAIVMGFLVTFASTPPVIVLARKIKAIDIPKDERRVHKKPIPLIGGLAIFYGFLVSVLCFAELDIETVGILISSALIVMVGIVDDKRDLSAKIKLLFQLIATGLVIWMGVRIEYIANPLSEWFGPAYIKLGAWSIPVTMLWIVGITNAVNLIDGLDGLAAGVSAIASVALLSLAVLSRNLNAAIIIAALAGAGFGFLPYNFNPAKIFMGDTGSMFLGFVLACVSIQGIMKVYALISFAVPILILGLPIFDTAFAILRRLFTGKPIMSADRGHLHHRLLDMGFSQRQTVAILYTLTSILCLTALVMSLMGAMRGLILVGAVLVLLVLTLIVMEPKENAKKAEETVSNEKNQNRRSEIKENAVDIQKKQTQQKKED